MDLHDVTMGRGDLVTTLNAIECSVLVVGISSDYLYPPEEVHFGADVLNHLGRRIRYREIRSPNGHDAFLLDTDQLTTFLRQLHVDEPGAVTARVERSVRSVRIGILGAGKVATSFVRLIKERRGQLIDSHGLDLDIRGVAEINREKWLDPIYGDVNVVFDPEEFVASNNFDVLVDLTRGLGSRGLVERALANRRHVVTPNKILLRAHGDDLDRLAIDRGVRLAYHDSIAAGWPLIYALERPLARGSVCEVHAVLSSACNVMLAVMEEGASFGRALRLAIERELTEPDPRLDTSGWDTAQKLGILLARVTGRRYTARNIETIGIDDIDPEWVRAAPRANVRVKLAALALRRGDELQAVVRPLAVPSESHLGLVRDLNHVVVLRDSDGGESVHLGSGAGALPVATAVLNDLIGLFDPRRSWTGRFPPAERAPGAPSFRRWFTLRDGKPSISEKPGRGAIPVADVLDQGLPA
jgi:homoserine dehydrogenase